MNRRNDVTKKEITLAIPGRKPLSLAHLVLDFTGTLSKDGRLLPGVAVRLRRLARRLRIVVATADTFGTAGQALAGLPVEVRFVKTGADKARMVCQLGPKTTVAIGNGHNDVPMFKAAALSIAVIGPEGAVGELIRVADIVVSGVHDALDLLAHPLRIVAMLRK